MSSETTASSYTVRLREALAEERTQAVAEAAAEVLGVRPASLERALRRGVGRDLTRPLDGRIAERLAAGLREAGADVEVVEVVPGAARERATGAASASPAPAPVAPQGAAHGTRGPGEATSASAWGAEREGPEPAPEPVEEAAASGWGAEDTGASVPALEQDASGWGAEDRGTESVPVGWDAGASARGAEPTAPEPVAAPLPDAEETGVEEVPTAEPTAMDGPEAASEEEERARRAAMLRERARPPASERRRRPTPVPEEPLPRLDEEAVREEPSSPLASAADGGVTGLQGLAFLGALLLGAGVFLPLVGGPLATLSYWSWSRTEGWLLLAFAAVAVVLLGARRVRLVALPAVAGLALLGYTYVRLSRMLGEGVPGAADEASQTLGRMLLGSFRFEYGWLVLLLAVLLLLVSAAFAGRGEGG